MVSDKHDVLKCGAGVARARAADAVDIGGQRTVDANRDLKTGHVHFMEPVRDSALVDLAKSTIAFDTNCLLGLYRRHFASTSSILKNMEAVQERFFLPAQVQREFWINRDGVLREVRDSGEAQDVSKAERAVKKSIEAAARWDIDADQEAQLKALVSSTFQQLKAATEGKSSRTRAWQALVDPSHDFVVNQLSEVFAGRTGQPYLSEVEADYRARGATRFAEKRPPGYEDADKPNGGYGDYLIWEQLVDRAQVDGSPIIFVTDDVKEDWWRLLSSGNPINARFELVEEMRQRAGAAFRTITFDDFLVLLSERPESDLKESEVDDTAELSAGESDGTDAALRWTQSEFDTFLLRLIEWGYHRQARVVQAASETPTGVLPRQAVLNVLELGRSAKLTAFTRPLRRIQLGMVEDGLLRPGLGWGLEAQYDGPGKAQRFAVPEEVAGVTAT